MSLWPRTAERADVDREQLEQIRESGVGGVAAASSLAANLSAWWQDLARVEVERTVPKAVEYGATDLVDIGRDLARCMGRTVTDEEAAELGVFFYVRGKLSRWVDAVARGDRVSDDTLFDIGVYIRMAQRIRSHGGWPGAEPQ